MRDFRKILVWQKAHTLTMRLYKETERFPKAELYGLTSQIRRAAASIPANIAEGAGRNSQAEFARFIHIASGSASELEYHLILAGDLGYLEPSTSVGFITLVTEIRRMLYGLAQTVRSNSRNPKL